MKDRAKNRPLQESESSAAKGCCSPSARHGPDFVDSQHLVIKPHIEPDLDMISLPGGSFLMGTDYEKAFPDDGEGPVREIRLSPFLIDRHTVTNARFARFVEATGYCTEAERFGWSFVFWTQVPRDRFYELVVDTVAEASWWCKVPGAHWRQPGGPGSTLDGRETHPVVHVSWNDAQAYSVWTDQRLPTEAEWEYAARGGLVQKLYPWGDKLRPAGEHRCNIWQGEFPRQNNAEDGYAETCPTDAFPPNDYGIYSITGNTWEWCSDWFSPEFHLDGPRTNPNGPDHGVSKVMKGGRFCATSHTAIAIVSRRVLKTLPTAQPHI